MYSVEANPVLLSGGGHHGTKILDASKSDENKKNLERTGQFCMSLHHVAGDRGTQSSSF
jgi:hypothetical protein